MYNDIFIVNNWIQRGKLTSLCNAPSLSKQIIKWRNEDINNCWAGLIYSTSLNYEQLLKISLPSSIKNAIDLAFTLIDEEINLQYALQIQASLPFFEISIPNYPTETKYNHHGQWVLQTLVRTLSISEPNFIIESCKVFCPNWDFKFQSDKDTLIFKIDKKNDSNLNWYVIVKYNNESDYWQLYLLLAKDLNENSNLSDIIFWDITFSEYLPEDINILKAKLSYCYHYFERYIDWISPQIILLHYGADHDIK